MRISATVGYYLIKVITDFKVNKVLEIGTLLGRSSIMMAAHLPDNGMVHTIEVHPESAELAMQNIKSVGMDHKIKSYTGDALKIIPAIEEKFDLIYIDANKSDYLKYLKASEHLLSKNGVVVADNVKMFGDKMKDYLEYVRRSGKYNSEYHDFGTDGIEVSVKL